MNLRLATAGAVLSTAALFAGFTGVAQAQDTQNCSDFEFQEDAQAAYDADPSDPNGLDGPPGEGFTGEQHVACEALPSRGESPAEGQPRAEEGAEEQDDVVPNTSAGVDTGGW